MLIVPRESTRGLAPASRPAVAVIHERPLYLAVLAELLSAPPLSAIVSTFPRADIALADVLTGDYRLVVCGLRSRPLSGTEVATAVRIGGGPPVALIADPEDADMALKALEDGADAVFTADVSQREFGDGIEAVLRGHCVMSDSLARRSLSRGSHEDERAPAIAAYRQLSSTEREILHALGRATPIDSIAAARGISKKTVRNHVASIYRKLALRSRSEAILWVARMRLAEPENEERPLPEGITA